jgi:hypothetical protein
MSVLVKEISRQDGNLKYTSCPNNLDVKIVLKGENFFEVFDLIYPLIKQLDFPLINSWEIPSSNPIIDKCCSYSYPNPNGQLIPPGLDQESGWLVASWVGVGLKLVDAVQGARAIKAGANVDEVISYLSKKSGGVTPPQSGNLDKKIKELRTKNNKENRYSESINLLKKFININPPKTNINNESESLLNGKFILDENIVIYITKNKSKINYWDLEIVLFIQESHRYQSLIYFLDKTTKLSWQLLQTGKVHTAKIQRTELYPTPTGGISSLAPNPPLLGNKDYLVVTTQAEIEQNYDFPEVFLNLNWVSVFHYGEQIIFARNLGTVENTEFKRRVYKEQWQLAYASKPKLTQYFYPPHEALGHDPNYASFDPNLRKLCGYEDQYLYETEYLTDEEIIEFSCQVESEYNIQHWEIYEIYNLIKEGKNLEGKITKDVRIIFSSQSMAERNKRPLLDIGAQVFFMNFDNKRQQLFY